MRKKTKNSQKSLYNSLFRRPEEKPKKTSLAKSNRFQYLITEIFRNRALSFADSRYQLASDWPLFPLFGREERIREIDKKKTKRSCFRNLNPKFSRFSNCWFARIYHI